VAGTACRCVAPWQQSVRPLRRDIAGHLRRHHSSSIKEVGEGSRRSPPPLNHHIKGRRLGHGAERWGWRDINAIDADLARSSATPRRVSPPWSPHSRRRLPPATGHQSPAR
jgi:hypothetical protein